MLLLNNIGCHMSRTDFFALSNFPFRRYSFLYRSIAHLTPNLRSYHTSHTFTQLSGLSIVYCPFIRRRASFHCLACWYLRLVVVLTSFAIYYHDLFRSQDYASLGELDSCLPTQGRRRRLFATPSLGCWRNRHSCRPSFRVVGQCPDILLGLWAVY